MNIYSKVNPEILLHTIYRLSDFDSARHDFTAEDKFLQGAVIGMDKGKKYRSHMHIECVRTTNMTQEAWVVLRGSVAIKYFDTDGSFLTDDVIREGDCSITFGGGHSFEGGDDDTIVYEFKSGPYHGREADKIWLEENIS